MHDKVNLENDIVGKYVEKNYWDLRAGSSMVVLVRKDDNESDSHLSSWWSKRF